MLYLTNTSEISFLVAKCASLFLICLSPSLNPIVYCWRYREIRQIVKSTMKKILRLDENMTWGCEVLRDEIWRERAILEENWDELTFVKTSGNFTMNKGKWPIINRELKQRRFCATHVNRKWGLLPFYMPWQLIGAFPLEWQAKETTAANISVQVPNRFWSGEWICCASRPKKGVNGRRLVAAIGIGLLIQRTWKQTPLI